MPEQFFIDGYNKGNFLKKVPFKSFKNFSEKDICFDLSKRETTSERNVHVPHDLLSAHRSRASQFTHILRGTSYKYPNLII